MLTIFCRQTFLVRTWCILISDLHWRTIVDWEKKHTGSNHANRWKVFFYWFKWNSIWATFHWITTFVLISCILPVCIWCCHCQYIVWERERKKDHGFLPFAAGFCTSALPENVYKAHKSRILTSLINSVRNKPTKEMATRHNNKNTDRKFLGDLGVFVCVCVWVCLCVFCSKSERRRFVISFSCNRSQRSGFPIVIWC